MFGKGNDFAKKITYRTEWRGTRAADPGIPHRHKLRIAVTVDMIATGTDIKPLEC